MKANITDNMKSICGKDMDDVSTRTAVSMKATGIVINATEEER